MHEGPTFLNQQEKTELRYTHIDRLSGEISQALVTAPLYKKIDTVKARVANMGEDIYTVMNDERVETSNIAKETDIVVTNTSGEQYIISAETFFSRYEATDDEGIYSAKGYCRAIKNPFQEPIEIFASWGEPQYGDKNCFIADICNSEGETMAGEPYIIDAVAFTATYRKIQ